MLRNTRNRSLLIYGTLGLCVTGCILWLLNSNQTHQKPEQSPTPLPTTSLSQPPQQSPSPCQKQGILTICHSLADIPNVPALTTVRFGGSTTFAPLNKPEVLALIKQAHPQFPLEHINPSPNEIPGSSTGIRWLIEGQHNLSFAQSSRPTNYEQYQKAKTRGFTLQQVEVAYDIFVIYVNRGLTSQLLKGLTLEQIRDIFTGRVTNWTEVGGPNLNITIIKRSTQGSNTDDVFQEKVLNNRPYGANKKEFLVTTQAIRATANTPGGVGVGSAALLINQRMVRVLPITKQNNSHLISPCADDTCQVVNKNLIAEQSYPEELTKQLFVVIKRDGTFNEHAGVAYANMLLSDEGQKLVEEAGFVPFRRIP